MTDPDSPASGFNLADELDDTDLQLNGLSRYGIDEGTVMAEPTDDALDRFQRTLYVASVPETAPSVTGLSSDEIVAVLLERDWTRSRRREVDAFALLCGATPPVDGKSGQEKPRPTPPAAPEPPDEPPADADDDQRAAHGKAVAAHDKAKTKHTADLVKYEKERDAWEAGWTGGVPTRQQLAALPWRAKAKLFGYLSGLFMNPTVPAGGGDTSA